ncbi:MULTISPECIES: MmgE/PrpD family protein [Bradyrhizobium]|uniref:2-methylcitrate dehydratase PrpD n=1 Tax=Bradyrhizobium elkanii TaxID=29448 RepID=A0A8I2C4Z9_BRAEL|nr:MULTISPECIES: MmgE/PrpD family protein [Bradyrhizobium]MBP1294503.1 2-methylcitrate dehydratase PrpD [Bradyrhizobium elkanii]MCP1925113.1 2-methylcitrate dehydratase PrpD [Bradyrhizobium elkanii]MCS3477398.1 2-methylcitrate dehydratase PrpD [Bradyrhizobium elkanii]MCS3584133.1 2-methylcitrate dehydratase PrpD [Bradyrhizobium elkanii]MCS3717713.1 2-methylcitrate dehydratase PrpD [Bradyrhizobium elkanii]
MLDITRQTANFVAGLKLSDLSGRCREAARTGIIDCVGVMIAGAAEQPVRIVSAMVAASTQNDGAPEVPSGRNLAAPDAALVNGVAAHVLDYDDVALAGHPSTVLVPAILAEGWSLDSSGADALAAYAAGYEVWAQVIALEPGHLHERGFHPTAVMGALATAAACARLRKLDSTKTAHAIAIAASLASGLVANFGTMTKSLHAGRTAQSGVLAARLADQGFTASLDVLEHQTGFLRAHSPSGTPEIENGTIDIGRNRRLADLGINVKRYPTCYATHRSIDAMIDLVKAHKLKPDDVKEIRVHTGVTQRLMLRNTNPQTGLEAKFSMEFAMTAALIAGRVGLSELTDEFVSRPDVGATFAKVRCTTTDEIMPGDQPFAPDDRVSVVLASGEVLEHAPVVHAKGSWQRPLSRDELQDKFMDCATRVFKQGHAAALFEQLWNIEDLESIRSLRLTNDRGDA